MRRRVFLCVLSGATIAFPFGAHAQQAQKQHRIAFQTLRQLGDTEPGNLVVERYSAEGRSDRFAALAATVVGRNPDVIVANSNSLVKTFTMATATIPIVSITADPIAVGLVTSLAHPGGNLTGVSIDAGFEIVSKRLQILKEALPRATKVAYLLSNAGDERMMSSYREAGQQLGMALTNNVLAEVNDAQLRRAFAEMAQQQFDAALVDEGGSFLALRALIVELAEKHRLPMIYPYRDYVDLGGLITYAPDLGELAQRLANDVHQILNGAKAGDIPFYQPSKFQLLINLKAARMLDINVPSSLLLRADEVIE